MQADNKLWYQSPELESVSLQFEEWRKVRKGGEPTPCELWELAIGLLDRHSIAKVSRFLGISSSNLKKRLNKKNGLDEGDCEEKVESSSFVELSLEMPLIELEKKVEGQCMLELYRSDGSHMKVYTTAGGELDINRLCESFVNFREQME